MIKRGNTMIKVENLSYSFPQKNLYNNISFTLEEGQHCAFIGTNGSLQIDDKVYFNKGVFISCQNKIHIEKNCQFGPDVKIIDNNHKFSRSKGVSTSEHTYGEITIGENSWIGANAVLLKKAKIGKNCVIGAGCVINQEIPDYSIVTLDSKNIVVESMRDN